MSSSGAGTVSRSSTTRPSATSPASRRGPSPSSHAPCSPTPTGSSYTDRPDFYRECVTAFGGRPGWHLVLQVGRRTDLDAIGDLPTGVEARRWVPQLAILLADTLVELGVVRRLDTAAATARALPGRPTSSSPSCADASDGRPSPWWGRAPVVVQR